MNDFKFKSTAKGSAKPAGCMLVTSLGDVGQLFMMGTCKSERKCTFCERAT